MSSCSHSTKSFAWRYDSFKMNAIPTIMQTVTMKASLSKPSMTPVDVIIGCVTCCMASARFSGGGVVDWRTSEISSVSLYFTILGLIRRPAFQTGIIGQELLDRNY